MARSPCVTKITYTTGKHRKLGLSFLILGLLSISLHRKACALEGSLLMNAISDRSWGRDQGDASESFEFADATCGTGSCSHTPKYASSGDRKISFSGLMQSFPFCIITMRHSSKQIS